MAEITLVARPFHGGSMKTSGAFSHSWCYLHLYPPPTYTQNSNSTQTTNLTISKISIANFTPISHQLFLPSTARSPSAFEYTKIEMDQLPPGMPCGPAGPEGISRRQCMAIWRGLGGHCARLECRDTVVPNDTFHECLAAKTMQ